MKKLKLSVGRSMGLVVLIAANFALARRAIAASADVEGGAPVFGVMLMGNLLVLGTHRLVTVPRSRHPFVLGFLAYGAVSLAAFVACAWAMPFQVASAFEWTGEPVGRLADLFHQGFPSIDNDYKNGMAYATAAVVGFYAVAVPVQAVLVGLPQVALATLGGLLSWGIARLAVPR